MASNARNLSKLLGTSTQVPTTALPPAIADLETVGETLSGGEIAPSSIKSNTLTQSFDSNQAVAFNMADSIDAVSPIVSVFKEVPQAGFSSKGRWDVNANATNYDFYDEKPISYASTTLTPNATGDGTFTSSNPVVSGYDISLISSGYVRQINATSSSGGTWTESAEYSSDGTKIYFSQRNSDIIKVFSLSTAYDITTIAGTSSSEYTLSLDAWAIRVNSAGTKIWVAYDASIEQFTLSSSHDISTASSDGTWTIGTYIRDIRFNNDGTKIYIADINSDDIKQYSLTTAYDITGTKTLDGSITGLTNPTAILFNSDGSKLYYGQQNNSSVYVKNLGTSYDITANVSAGTTVAWDSGANSGSYEALDMSFNFNGTRLFILHTQSGSPYHKFLSEFTSGSSNVFNSSDVGKKVVGNSGSAIITSTAGTYKSVTAFADTSAISSWTLTASQGKADGSGIELSGYSTQNDIVFPTGASGSGSSMVYNNNISPTSSVFDNLRSVVFNNEGTIALLLKAGTVLRFNLSTAFDLSTMTEASGDYFTAQLNSNQFGIGVKPDGTRIWVSDYNNDAIKQFTLSTPWSPSTQSYDGYYSFNSGGSWNSFSGGGGAPSSSNFNPFSFQFNSDGTKLLTILWDNNPYHSIAEFTLSTGWDMSTMSYTSYANLVGNSDPEAIAISADGLKLMMHGSGLGDAGIEVYSLPSAFSVGSAGSSLTRTSGAMDISTLTGNSSNNITYGGLSMSSDGKRMWIIYNNNGGANPIYEITGGTTSVHPYSTYSPALTNSSTGQINSSSWQDINSMTADETKNDGDIFYAVSTDNRSSWGVAKGSDGVRKIVKNNSGTWQYNNDGGTSSYYDFSNPTAGATSTFTAPSWNILAFSTDGSKLIAFDNGYLKLKSYNLSTAWDISTISSSANAESSISTGDFYGATISADGTKLIGYVNSIGYVYEYTMSTPFDVTTLTADGNANSLGGAGTSNAFNWFIKPGTYNTAYAVINRHLYKYTFTGGSITTGTVTRDANFLDLDPANQKNYINNGQFQFKPDGTEFYIGQGTDDIIEKWTLSTAWDITTATKSSETVSSVDARSIWLKPNGEKIYYIDQSDSKKIKEINIEGFEYGTNETWVNGTNNNEHATLQQALTSQSFNRMNKAQLDAVADGYHFSQDSADTLDLMIAPYAASGTSPISDGVTINYDAEALIREAIPGTDYIAEFPNPTTLNITAVGAANLKIRAQ